MDSDICPVYLLPNTVCFETCENRIFFQKDAYHYIKLLRQEHGQIGCRLDPSLKKSIERKAKLITPLRGKPFYAEEVLTSYDIKLRERMTCNANIHAPPKIILSWNAGHSQANLGGCPDWNCKLSNDHTELAKADAILLAAPDHINRSRDPYFVYFSQESPKNARPDVLDSAYFNMSLGFRHDSPSSSPYGYTVKLSEESRPAGEYYNQVMNVTRVVGKTKGAAWFVSHCDTNSKREKYVNLLKTHFPVDVYGVCGNMNCVRGGACENMLDDEYHFYIAFENSICKDYITEKLWHQGYGRDVIPIVLKRAVVEHVVPPNSFIAADDFSTTRDLAAHLHYLMRNKTAYICELINTNDINCKDAVQATPEISVITTAILKPDDRQHLFFLHLRDKTTGKEDFDLEREDFKQYWDESCEDDGELVDRIILNEMTNLTSGSSVKLAGKLSNTKLI
ncbi:fucosyl transferase [Oesophagostomum dentatum]|uniref:Fucosyltransferase n=1 Tax=Oesophagostomum dentatum TaxID=61180 RepID=A0A0B1TR82_OESDE|nr:fucosyl transferase [Oesophagostomum dentatum]